jgi:uncharacterized delta-60 repeat protein
MVYQRAAADRRGLTWAAVAIISILTASVLTTQEARATPVIPEPPIREWQFSEFHPDGEVVVDSGTKVAGQLSKLHSFGPATFPDGAGASALGGIFSSRRGDRYWVQTQAADGVGGTKALLTQLQAFTKVDPDGELGFSIKEAIVEAVDFNGTQLTSAECPNPDGSGCQAPIDAMVNVDISAYNSHRTLFRTAGTMFFTGWAGHWELFAWSEAFKPLTDPLWQPDDFVAYIDEPEHRAVRLRDSLDFDVDLSTLGVSESFTLRNQVSVSVMNRRGRESGILANLIDPRGDNGVVLRGTGLEPAPDPLPEPPVESVATPTCDPEPDPAAGTLQLSASTYPVSERAGEGRPVVVTRTGGGAGEVSATLTTTAGTAAADADFMPVTTTVTFADGDTAPRGLRIPILEDAAEEPDETVQIALSEPHCAAVGSPSAAELTIVDDDRPVEPGPSYTIGGTVSGLEGTGLVLNNLGQLLPAGNGSFAFPIPVADGIPYDVRVHAQPTNPAQICTVTDGAGTVTGADVDTISVACATPEPTSGLDPTFGEDGKVTVHAGGHGARAMVVQPDGMIVAAGEFSLARFTPEGAPDPAFGGGAPITTGLSTGFFDDASDVAVQADGKIVVVGIANGATDDFGIERYKTDGTPDEMFGEAGRVVTDISGGVDRAYSVALQPDGRIVVAGHAQGAFGTGNDFAVARYLPNGDPDPDFGSAGVVTTDVAGVADFAHAVAVQDDGAIVVAGRATDDGADQSLGVVRYTSAGVPDPTFGSAGNGIGATVVGVNGRGIALQPDGAIVIAGDAQSDIAVARLLPSGGLDPAFGGDGVVTTDFGVLIGGFPGAEGGMDLALHADGRIVVVGVSQLDRTAELAMTRYEPDGDLDTSFDSDGKLSVSFFGGFDAGHDVAVQPDGKIVAAGTASNGLTREFGLIRLAG